MRALAILTAVAVLPAALGAQSAESLSQAARGITPEDVAHRIGVIADDSMRGRNTPSRGLDLTAQYIASEFQSFGLEPGGDDGTFLQRYPLLSLRLVAAGSGIRVGSDVMWQVKREVRSRTGATGPDGVSGPVVVVQGLPSSRDAVQRLPLEGAVVLYVQPHGMRGDSARMAQAMPFFLRRTGAVAVVAVVNTPDSQWEHQLTVPIPTRMVRGSPDQVSTPWLEVRDQTVTSVLQQHGFDLSAARAAATGSLATTPLPDLTLTVIMHNEVVEKRSAPNTVGILEGNDSELKNEYIVFSAHMDHLGTAGDGSCRAKGADSICNGADDDASGTIAVVELAEAFANLHPRPKRSLIFLTVSGEEKGLWGSAYFTAHPPVPIEHIVADLNADMVSRNWRDTIVVIGKEHSDLGETLNRVNAEHPELNMTAIDDIWPEQNFYGRSDHYNFARRGVPILFFFNGTHEDYHQASDELQKIDAEKESRIVKLIFYLGLDVANAANRPQWNPESYKKIVSEGGRAVRR